MKGFFPVFANILLLETKCNKSGWKQDFESYFSLMNKSTWKVQQDLPVALLSGHLSPRVTSCDPSSGVNSSSQTPESSPDPAHVAQTFLHPHSLLLKLTAQKTSDISPITFSRNFKLAGSGRSTCVHKQTENLITKLHSKFSLLMIGTNDFI